MHTLERKEIYKKFCLENLKGGDQLEDLDRNEITLK
jgi:hypothetical protein